MGALTGIVVLDLSWLFPGPYCTCLLRSMGAEVWRVERPGGGDLARSLPAFFANLNWGKKGVTLDLQRAEGKAVFRRLVEKADVVVEGFRPGIVTRLGVDYTVVREINPKIVYCSISGFGQDGPYRNKPGHDANYQALSGVLSLYAKQGVDDAGLALPLGDCSSGLFAAFGVVSALLERHTTGRGKYVDISMTDGLFTWAAMWDLWEFPSNCTSTYPGGEIPHYGIFEARDGKLLALGLVNEEHLWRNLCAVVGLSKWLDLDFGARIRKREEIAAELRCIFRQKDGDEWLRLLEAADVPLTQVNTVGEAARDQQLVSRRLISQVRGLGGVTVPVVRNPVLPPDSGSEEQGPPELGEHTVEVLEKVGYSQEEIERLRGLGII